MAVLLFLFTSRLRSILCTSAPYSTLYTPDDSANKFDRILDEITWPEIISSEETWYEETWSEEHDLKLRCLKHCCKRSLTTSSPVKRRFNRPQRMCSRRMLSFTGGWRNEIPYNRGSDSITPCGDRQFGRVTRHQEPWLD